jgi:hypothetical protein
VIVVVLISSQAPLSLTAWTLDWLTDCHRHDAAEEHLVGTG